jgi:hypothetical protein
MTDVVENMVILMAYMGGLCALCAVGVIVADYALGPLAAYLERRRLAEEFEETTRRR